MIRVGSPASRSSTVSGGRRRRAADVNGAISDSSPGRPLMRIVRRPSETTSGARRVDDLGHDRLLGGRGLGQRLGPARRRASRLVPSNASSAPQSSTGRRGARGPSGRGRHGPRHRAARSGARGRAESSVDAPIVGGPPAAEPRFRGRTDPLVPGRVLWHRCSSIRPLTGLADGLAPDDRRYAESDSPHLPGSPAPRIFRGLSGCAAPHRNKGGNPASERTYDKPHGRNQRPHVAGSPYFPRSADGLGDVGRHVLGVLALHEVGGHLAVAPRAAILDGVEDEALGRAQVVEVRAHLGDGVAAFSVWQLRQRSPNSSRPCFSAAVRLLTFASGMSSRSFDVAITAAGTPRPRITTRGGN